MPTADSETIIRPRGRWLRLDVPELWAYRDLAWLMVRRDFVSRFKQTILGPLWYIVNPVLTTVVFAAIFSGIAGIPTDGLPSHLFYLGGLLGWGYFGTVLGASSGTLTGNAHLFGKVYFPRLIVPVTAAASALVGFLIQLLTFAGYYGYYKAFTDLGPTFQLGWAAAWIPLLLLQIAALGLGVGLFLSALTAKYRDFAHLTGFLVQLWMYATPIIYPLSRVPEEWRWLAALNPLTTVTEAFRLGLLGRGQVDASHVALSAGLTAVTLFFGYAAFCRVERNFIDTV